MIPENLAEKQQELLTKSKEKRAIQNGKNASGPRKKVQPTERTPRSVIPLLRVRIKKEDTSDKYLAYYVYCIDRLERSEAIVTYCEFYKQYRPKEEDTDDATLRDFQIREISPANN